MKDLGHTKKEIEAKATKAGVIWFVDEDAVVLPWMPHTKKPENTKTLKKAELRKDEEEMAHYHKHQW